MPEGPEIRRAADRIASVLVGRPIADARLPMPKLRHFRSRLLGSRVVAVDTRGKAMLTRFDNGLTLFSHNQLYGRWYITRRDRTPKTGRSLRLVLHTETHSAWLYSASNVEFINAEELERHSFLCRIGPDVLDAGLKPRHVCERLEERQFCRRGLGNLYLDQSFLAGIGNYLRSEILFSAGCHPGVRPVDLERKERMRLARATLLVSNRAYTRRGVTVPRRLEERLKAAGLGYSQYRHWVFGRTGKSCYQCGTPIVRQRIASRKLFFCPACQAEAPISR